MPYKFKPLKCTKKLEKGAVDIDIIVALDDETGNIIPSPYTLFLKDEYYHTKYNTCHAAATKVCEFLNYYKNYGKPLYELSIEDVELFLNEKIVSGNLYTSVISNRSYLNRFFYYLVKKQQLQNIKITDFTFTNSGPCSKECLHGPFKIYTIDGNNRGKNHKPKKLKNIEIRYFYIFINVAIQVAPDIALGIIFLFTGGLRVGEVVNLTKGSIEFIGPYGQNGYILTICKNYFEGGVSTGYTKRERMQRTIGIGEIAEQVYKMHMKHYINARTDALFVDRYGKPMNTNQFRYRFTKVKRAFIDLLKYSGKIADVSYASRLEALPWSTHIGRAFYSNYITKQTPEPSTIASARGDNSVYSVVAYLDQEVIEETGKVFKAIYEDFLLNEEGTYSV